MLRSGATDDDIADGARGRRHATSGPATRSARCTSSARRSRCRRSVAEPQRRTAAAGRADGTYTRRHVGSRFHPSRPARTRPDGRRHARRNPAIGGPSPGPGCTCRPTPPTRSPAVPIGKGDVLAVARVAGIQAAKRTPELIPLCHPLLVGAVLVNFRLEEDLRRGRGRGRDLRPHRGRDGGAHRLHGRGAHRLRHVQVARTGRW